MELIRISNSKLKIMLTPMDMRQFELSTDNFYDDSEKMHHSFRLLLDEVKRQSGFDADDHRISVQYFPSRENTRLCSGKVRCVWNPTRLYMVPSAFSLRS